MGPFAGRSPHPLLHGVARWAEAPSIQRSRLCAAEAWHAWITIEDPLNANRAVDFLGPLAPSRVACLLACVGLDPPCSPLPARSLPALPDSRCLILAATC